MNPSALVTYIDLAERELRISIEEVDPPDDPPPSGAPPDKPTRPQDGEINLNDVERELRLEEGAVRIKGGLTDVALRKLIGYGLLILFTISTLGAVSVIILLGRGWLILSEKIVMTYLTATVVQAATMLYAVVRYLFPSR
jgi:hypothetical protein